MNASIAAQPVRRIGAIALVVAGMIHAAGAFQIQAKAWLAQRLLAKAWDRSVAGEVRARPWPWADTQPVAQMRLPGQPDALIVLSGATGPTLAFGPGHMDGSVVPGETGNSVIAGHRDTHFSPLSFVEPGDEIFVDTPDGRSHRFMVFDTVVVDSRTSRLRLDTQEPTLTLVTCFPFDALDAGGPLRYLVHARLARDFPDPPAPGLTL